MSRWLVLIGLITMVVGIGGAGYGVWSIWNQHQMITSALPVPAKVLGHRTKDLKASGFVAKIPLVKYEYTVNQQPYTCEAVTPDEFMLPNTWSESVFKQFPIGADTKAKYDPKDPSKAFLIGKYSVKPYLPLLISLVIAAMGLGVVGDQLMNRDTPNAAHPTISGEIVLGAKQHHLTRARVLGIVGIIGLICGAPAILHHLSVSTSPHERMGFLMEGAYGIAVLIVLVRSFAQFRQGYGFGTPVVTLNRSLIVGQSSQLNIAMSKRRQEAVQLSARLKCEAVDTRLFSFSEENPNRELLDQEIQLAKSESVTRDDEIRGTAELTVPDHMPPSTPVDSAERTHVVWSLILTAQAGAGRKAETEYIVTVANSQSG